jgi:hypothetical protein
MGSIRVFESPQVQDEPPFVVVLADEAARPALRERLAAAGYRVLIAVSAQHAHDLTTGLGPDLIVVWRDAGLDQESGDQAPAGWLAKLVASAESQGIPLVMGAGSPDRALDHVQHQTSDQTRHGER